MAVKLRRLIRPSRNRRSAVFDLSVNGWLDKDAYLAGWFDVDLITLAGAAQPDGPFNLTEGIDEGLEDLGLELSQYSQTDDVAQPDTPLPWQDDLQDAPDELDGSSYQQLDDDPVAQPDSLRVDLAFDDATELDAPDLSAYVQVDDDAAQPDVLSIDQYFDDDTSTEPVELSIYSQVDDDLLQPDTIFGAFDFIEDAGIFDSGESFYYQQDDDASAVVTPPTGSGGAAGKTYVISGRRELEPLNHYVPIKREPFEVKPEAPKEPDLKQLRDRLLDLGRALERNKLAVKDRIRAEQAKPFSPDLLHIMQLLINEYEIELYNQNAARLLIILADEI